MLIHLVGGFQHVELSVSVALLKSDKYGICFAKWLCQPDRSADTTSVNYWNYTRPINQCPVVKTAVDGNFCVQWNSSFLEFPHCAIFFGNGRLRFIGHLRSSKQMFENLVYYTVTSSEETTWKGNKCEGRGFTAPINAIWWHLWTSRSLSIDHLPVTRNVWNFISANGASTWLIAEESGVH